MRREVAVGGVRRLGRPWMVAEGCVDDDREHGRLDAFNVAGFFTGEWCVFGYGGESRAIPPP
eukprot:13804874-Heterocapsa_arctica.AAC.1